MGQTQPQSKKTVESCSAVLNLKRCRNCKIREETMAGELSPDELDRLDAIMISRKFEPHNVILIEGEDAAVFYNIYEGVVRLLKILPDGRRSVVGFLFPGDFFGFSVKGAYEYTAEAVTRVKMCCFQKVKIEKLFDEIPKLERRLLGKMTEKLLSSHSQLADLGRKSPKERLARFLLDLSKVESLRKPAGAFQLPMSREDISDYLGLTVETISRTLSSFAKDGLIKVDQFKTITLLKPKELHNLSEGARTLSQMNEGHKTSGNI